MMKLVRRVLIVVGVVVSPHITTAIGLTAQKGSTLRTASLNASQRSEISTMRGLDRPHTQGAAKADEGNYELLVRAEIPTSEPKESLELTLTLRNKSQSVIYVVERMPSRDFKFEVKDIDGKTVLPRARRGLVVDEGKNSLVPVNAGHQVSYNIRLSDLYNVSSGEYTLTVKKVIFLSDKKTNTEVKSGPIKLVVKSSK